MRVIMQGFTPEKTRRLLGCSSLKFANCTLPQAGVISSASLVGIETSKILWDQEHWPLGIGTLICWPMDHRTNLSIENHVISIAYQCGQVKTREMLLCKETQHRFVRN